MSSQAAQRAICAINNTSNKLWELPTKNHNSQASFIGNLIKIKNKYVA